MYQGEKEICELCGRDIANESCSAAYDHKPRCGEIGSDHSLPAERSRPDICPDCMSDGYKELHKTFETLARPVKENIASLRDAAAANQDLLNQILQMYLRRVHDSSAIIRSPDTNSSMKDNASSTIDAARKYMQPLMEQYSRSATRLAKDMDRAKQRLRAIQCHHLEELNSFREKYSLGVVLHPAHASSPTPQSNP